MALTPYQDSIQQSSSGFNQKLAGLLSVGQAIKASQTARQQMQEQLRQQKELIDYKADVSFEQQKRLHNEITLPQQQADAQATQQKAILDSLEKASNEVIDLRENFLDSSKNPAREFGFLNNVDFQPINRGDNQFTPMPVMFTESGAQPMDWQTYQREQADANRAAELLLNIRNNGADLDEVEQYESPDGTLNIGSNNYAEVINNVRREGYKGPTMTRLLQANQQQQLNVKQPTEQRVEQTRLNVYGADMKMLSDRLGIDPSQPLVNLVENMPTEDTGMLWWKQEGKPISLNLNFAHSYGQNSERIEEFAQQVGVDLTQIPKGNTESEQQIRRMIISGDVTNLEGFASEQESTRVRDQFEQYAELAEQVQKLKDLLPENRYNFLMKYYADTPSAYNEWATEGYYKGSKLPTLDDIVPNFGYGGEIDKVFKTVDSYRQSSAELLEQGNHIMNR